METCTFKHTARIEVRYAETDQMGIVHHSVYAVWFEQARTEYFREAGASYADMEAEGFAAPVLELNVRFRQPTRTQSAGVPLHEKALTPGTGKSCGKTSIWLCREMLCEAALR